MNGSVGKIKTVFKAGGSVTTGNLCGRNDRAAALLVMSEEKAKVWYVYIKPLFFLSKF
ncbi:MAG TPA: hypothetical protein VNS08_11840 [Ureibacillus sp.]|nr:hypothetical protein [Ureibacillus sp.]